MEKTPKKEYVFDKEYVLYLTKGSGDEDGFVVEDNSLVENGNNGSAIVIDHKKTFKVTPMIANATRMTSVEANRNAMLFHNNDGRYPFKMKICNYKDLVF